MDSPMRFVYTGVWIGDVLDDLAKPKDGDYFVVGMEVDGEFQDDVIEYRFHGAQGFAVYDSGQIKWPSGQRSPMLIEGEKMTLMLGNASTVWELDVPKVAQKPCPTCNGTGTVPA